MQALLVLRGWASLLNPQLVCALVHTLETSTVPQSPFHHTYTYPKLRSAEELEDINPWYIYAFFYYQLASQTALDCTYASGLSVTHGSPQRHIWTFAAGNSKDHSNAKLNCPCASPYPSLRSCTSICGRELVLWVREYGNSWRDMAPWWSLVGITGVYKWEHLLWSRWSMVHYHTEPGSERRHRNEDMFLLCPATCDYRSNSTWDIHLLRARL